MGTDALRDGRLGVDFADACNLNASAGRGHLWRPGGTSLAHPLARTRVAIDFSPDISSASITCQATVETVGPTGVEMEALTAVQVALLTIYDMCKAADRGMTMTDIRLLEKHGGKSGSFIATP